MKVIYNVVFLAALAIGSPILPGRISEPVTGTRHFDNSHTNIQERAEFLGRIGRPDIKSTVTRTGPPLETREVQIPDPVEAPNVARSSPQLETRKVQLPPAVDNVMGFLDGILTPWK